VCPENIVCPRLAETIANTAQSYSHHFWKWRPDAARITDELLTSNGSVFCHKSSRHFILAKVQDIKVQGGKKKNHSLENLRSFNSPIFCAHIILRHPSFEVEWAQETNGHITTRRLVTQLSLAVPRSCSCHAEVQGHFHGLPLCTFGCRPGTSK